MADEAEIPDEDEDAEAGEAKPKKGRLKLVLFLAAGLFVLGGGAALAYVILGDQLLGGEERVEVAEPHFYDLPEMTVNLSGEGGQATFLQLSVSLELADAEMEERVATRVTRVVDAFQVYLRELRREDLEGSAGVYRLKQELRRRVNLAVHPANVEDILFREILVQ